MKLIFQRVKKTTLACVFLAVFCSSFLGFDAFGQSKSKNGKEDLSNGIRFSKPVESVWEFGLVVNSTGDSRGITASVPIPKSWPEQDIEILSEERTDNVGRFRVKNVTKYTQQFSFGIGQITGGQPETAFIRFKVKKRMIVAPKDTSQFSVPKKVPSKVRTFLKPSPFIESTHKRIKAIAKELRDKKLNGWDQAEKNYKWVRDEVQYVFDEKIHSCLDALDTKTGDCEELSSLFIAICRAQGIPARAVWIPDHTYPEFFLLDKEGKGHWFPCQAAGQYEFGAMTETKPVLQKGDRFRNPGERKDVRYLRPTLVAKQPAGQISIEWISRKVEDTEE